MGRGNKKKTAEAATQTELNELIESFSTDITKLQGELTDLQSKLASLQSKLEIDESERAWQQKCVNNERIEDKEIIMGLEYQVENKIPEALMILEAETESKLSTIDKRIESINGDAEKCKESFKKEVVQNKLKINAYLA